MLLFILLNLLDCISTYFGLKLGLSEGNFLLGKLFSQNIWLGLAVKMFLSLVVLAVLYFIDKLYLLKIINYVLGVIVALNIIYVIIALIIL